MSEPQQPLEAGRYALFEAPDGNLVIARTTDGGEKMPNIILPPVTLKMLRGEEIGMGDLAGLMGSMPGVSLNPVKVMRAMKEMRNGRAEPAAVAAE